jgi:hypothetical protein
MDAMKWMLTASVADTGDAGADESFEINGLGSFPDHIHCSSPDFFQKLIKPLLEISAQRV